MFPPPASQPASQPAKLSILIVTYNRASVLKNGLESLAKLTADKQLYEIIVVNNNCTDHTSEVCQNFAKAHPDTSFRQAVELQPGAALARNKAVAEAKYEILAFIDDDATVEPNYVDTIMKAFKDYPEYNAGGGKILHVFEDEKDSKKISKYFGNDLDYGDATKEWPAKTEAKYPPGCNMFFRKEIFEKYGDFDTNPLRIEDKHMFHKLKINKERVLYAPEVIVYHHVNKERYKYENVTKLAYYNGKSLASWLANASNRRRRAMFVEKIFKFAVSIGLGAFYCITLHPIKAKYLIGHMYHQMKGYFNYWRIKEK